MKGQLKKISIIFVMIITITIFLVSSRSMALEVQTHRAINEYITQTPLNNFFLDDYLKTQLGMQTGVKTKYNNQEVFKWIGEGGKYEDEPPECINLLQRPRNHFHNPIADSGYTSLLLSGLSAVDWINQPTYSQDCGWYSWNDVRSYYYYALKAPEKATREYYFAQTFRGLGQLMHLVQDMSVPEHTRNDGHIFFNYEKWVNRAANRNRIQTQYSINIKYFTFDSAYPLNVENLFDTQQYDGTNPDITYNNNVGLSEYTNANFFSRDTIFKNFPYPALAQTELDSSGSYLIKKGHGETNGAGERIEHLACTTGKLFYKYLPASLKSWALKLDDTVYEEYASKLMPRAIGYSSQLLQYFFRGKLEVELGDENETLKTLKIKNTSNEIIVGGNVYNRFELYYDNTSDVRTLLTSAQANTLAPGGEQTINFNAPTEDVKAFILVYHGKFGDEPNAVIAKFIDNDGSVWVAGEDTAGCLGLGNDYENTNVLIPRHIDGGVGLPIRYKYAQISFAPPIQTSYHGESPIISSALFRQSYHDESPVILPAIFQQYNQNSSSLITLVSNDSIWIDYPGFLTLLKYDWDASYEGSELRYILDESSLPEVFYQNGREYIYQPPYDGEYYHYYHWVEAHYAISQSWKKVQYTPAKGLPFFHNWTWATIGSYTAISAATFLINNLGEMYCSGGNEVGELGIGQAMGYHVANPEFNTNFSVPNYYTKNFIKVPGNDWKMVITSKGITWALKNDGTLWVTGYRNGVGASGTAPLNTFTKYDDTIWRSLYFGGSDDIPGVIKEVGDNYELYKVNDNGVLTLMSIVSKSDWITYLGNITPEEYVASMQGGLAERTFIGGSITDNYSKPLGTLWSVNEGYGFLPINEVPGNNWIFTAGAPYREVSNDGVSAPSQSVLITGGGTIAIKAAP